MTGATKRLESVRQHAENISDELAALDRFVTNIGHQGPMEETFRMRQIITAVRKLRFDCTEIMRMTEIPLDQKN